MDVVGFALISLIAAYAAWRIKSAERQMHEAIRSAAQEVLLGNKMSPDDIDKILRGYIPGVDNKYRSGQ